MIDTVLELMMDVPLAIEVQETVDIVPEVTIPMLSKQTVKVMGGVVKNINVSNVTNLSL